jgi:acetyltransferase
MLAARPYPAHLMETWVVGSDSGVFIRPALREDHDLVARFLSGLGADSHYQRHFQHGEAPDLDLLLRLDTVDYRQRMALVAVSVAGSREVVVAHAEYVAEGEGAELAMVVADGWQRRGLGSHLLRRLMHCAALAGLKEIHGQVLATNEPMIRLARRSGFQLLRGDDARLLVIRRVLTVPEAVGDASVRRFVAKAKSAAAVPSSMRAAV